MSEKPYPFSTVALPDGIVVGGPWPHTTVAWPGVAEATGLRAGPCLEVAKEFYRDGQTNLPDGLKS